MDQVNQNQIMPPGTESEMTPQADHGEESYKGAGGLAGRVASSGCPFCHPHAKRAQK